MLVFNARSGTSKSGKMWMAQDFVIQQNDRFSSKCFLTLFGEEKIKEAALSSGQKVTVDFDIDAREYQGRWYNSFNAYKITKEEVTPNTITQQDDTAPF